MTRLGEIRTRREWGSAASGVGAAPLAAMFFALIFSPATAWANPTTDTDRLFDRVWAAYVPTLHAHFIDHLDFDDATLDALAHAPKTTVRLRLRLDRRGGVQTVEVLDVSSVERFTRACVDAARRMGRLPDLPAIIHDRGRREGVEFVFGTQ